MTYLCMLLWGEEVEMAIANIGNATCNCLVCPGDAGLHEHAPLSKYVELSIRLTGPAMKLHCGASPPAPSLRDSAKPCSIHTTMVS